MSKSSPWMQWTIKTHRLLGALMSILLVAWFISGFVLIYHHYPKYSPSEYEQQLQPLEVNHLPSAKHMDSWLSQYPDSLKLSQLSLQGAEYGSGNAQIILMGKGRKTIRLSYSGDSLSPCPIDRKYLDGIAARWQRNISQIDTLSDLDQWTPFSRLREDLPFYRLRLQGGDGYEIYVSSRTGEVLQESTQSERLWSWVGAIPHWIYFTWLRQDRDAWTWTIIILGAIGTLMAITGFVIGIYYFRLRYKKKAEKLYSPFPKRRYQWHHFFGTIGGVFIVLWLLTGLLSVVRFSDGDQSSYDLSSLRGKLLPLNSYQTSIEQLLNQEPTAKVLTYSSWGETPIISLGAGEDKTHWDARKSEPTPLKLDTALIAHELRHIFGAQVELKAEWLDKYDGYYISHSQRLPLPVWRFSTNTQSHHTIYVDPSSGYTSIITDADRMESWRFEKFHRFHFAFLANQSWLWAISIWFFLILGTITSLTGLWMSFDYLRRLLRKRKRK